MNDNDPAQLAAYPEAARDWLTEQAEATLAHRGTRVAIGIAGGPGVGKSTLATELVAALNARTAGIAAYVPMDGFHMLHAKLEGLGTAKDKGAPHTFEGGAFAEFLEALKSATGPISGPGYSREIEDVVLDAFIVPAAARSSSPKATISSSPPRPGGASSRCSILPCSSMSRAKKSAPACSSATPSTACLRRSATLSMSSASTWATTTPCSARAAAPTSSST